MHGLLTPLIDKALDQGTYGVHLHLRHLRLRRSERNIEGLYFTARYFKPLAENADVEPIEHIIIIVIIIIITARYPVSPCSL
jgi:hypothetical protein